MQLEVSTFVIPHQRARFSPPLVLSLLLNLIPAVWTPPANAQVSQLSAFENSEGEISGTVLLEPDKRPASQVAVSLKSRAAGIVRSVLTDLEGHFKVRNLPQGTYDIAVDEEGYESALTSAKLDGPSSNLVMYLKSKSGSVRRDEYVVSVRELKIPGKAKEELRKGLEQGAQNDAAGSLRHFVKATQTFPGYFEAYYNIGIAEMTLQRTDEAAKAFQTAIDLSGGRYALAEFGYGYALCQQGRPADAEKIIRRGLEVDDTGPQGFVILGETLIRLHRPDEAEKSAQEALLRNPNYPGAYLVLSDVAGGRGDYRAEVRYLDTYLKLLPNGPANAEVRQVREAAQRMLAASQAQD
jgi:tetratricopeptide (TPR) repeat protein